MRRILLFLSVFCFISVSHAFAQTGSISGTVTDQQSGKPLVGTNVYIPNLERGASTDVNGHFKISNVPTGTYKLRASYIGYSNKTKQVQVGTQEQVVNFELIPASANLDELVVTGFGTQSKRNLIGSVSSLSSQDISTNTVTTVDQTLQGKTAGVQVTSTSGVLGAPVSVRVRGTTSINASSQPLYVVDGIPLVNSQIGASLGEPGNQAVNPLVNLDPNNIKSIQVLKDASATAVYGSRGANGVVLITTKDGVEGNTQINVNTSIGFTEPTKKYDLMSSAEFAKAYNYKSTHLAGGQPDPNGLAFFGQVLPAPDKLPNSNWADVVTRTGSIQNYSANVSGGNSKTQFYLSGTYNDQLGYAVPNKLQKYSALAKVDHKFNDQLSLGLSVNPSRSLNNRISTSNQVSAPYTLAALEAPFIPKFTSSGDVNSGFDPSVPLNAFSAFPGTPYGNRVGIDRASTVTNLLTDAHVAYDFLPQLTLKTQFNVQYLQSEEEVKQADYSTDGYPVGAGFANNEQYLNYNWRNTLHYNNDWQDNSLEVLLAVTFQKNDYTSINVNGNTFLSNQLLNLNSAAKITGGGGSGTSYAFQNNLARLTYTYKDRYIVTLTGSYNGSSRFGKNNRYGFFPAAALGWIISDEPFAQADWLSFLKLHGSYGVVGNANGIGNFDQLALLGSGADYNSNPGVRVSQLASPDLSWERTKELDVGIDYGFINNRIRGSIGYYRKNTSDLLLGVPVSATNGFTSFTKNIGGIRNSGFEFDITADLVANKNLSWSINGNISTLKNKVTNIPGEFIRGHNTVREGKPLGTFFLRKYMGVDPNNGDALYADGNGGTTSNYNAAPRMLVGDPFADFFGGFGSTLNYKGLDASVQFQFTEGNKTYWQNGEFLATNMSSIFNQSASQLDYWTPNNKDATVPEPRSVSNGNLPSTRYLLDASYLRLKNATIGYTLPRQWINGYKLRLYVQGSNLLTFTGYKGLDPEVTSSSERNVRQGNTFFELPQAREILFGLQLGL
ncbi:MAG TPA: TonB-dependent receptor [Balneolaceae bacterium]|nr:TonB-dependent receptor [Balneolaceae bacterium]